MDYPVYAAKRRKKSVFIRPTRIIRVPVFCRFVTDLLLI